MMATPDDNLNSDDRIHCLDSRIMPISLPTIKNRVPKLQDSLQTMLGGLEVRIFLSHDGFLASRSTMEGLPTSLSAAEDA